MKPKLINYLTPAIQAKELAKTVADELSSAISKKGKATLAVPGGTTPDLFLMELSLIDITWSQVTVILTDERWVSVDSDRSNFALLSRSLGQNKAESANFLPYFRDAITPEDAIDELEQTLLPHLPVDVSVVGMGADMHTASLFPHADGLEHAISLEAKRSLAVIRPKDSDEIRITLTAPVFTATTNHHVLIKGENKLKALEQAKSLITLKEAPIRLILEQTSTLIHYTS